MIFTLTLGNGKVFSGLRAAGDCLVSKAEVKAEDFSGGLRKAVLTAVPEPEEEGAEGFSEEIEGAKLGGIFSANGEWYFWLDVPDERERAVLKASADVEYIAMMTGVEL